MGTEENAIFLVCTIRQYTHRLSTWYDEVFATSDLPTIFNVCYSSHPFALRDHRYHIFPFVFLLILSTLEASIAGL